ncbi:galactose-binding like protein [Neocallimastix californiae]|uniref:rhamnogalacturonan endolyase n=1 Tax=Neocallimastix californiae TaxID=1754190 RepID=A0A1Y2DWY2_9FUNG|nr:galactose-binding like protein [Neocallimastix californiae]|eukprot:ORY63614.1 galactose-binding like protein [Neocallimastix californiae]
MKFLFFSLLITIFASIVSAVSLTQNNNSYTLKNNYATVVISKKDGYITSLKIAGDNQEFLNRSYIDANGSKAGFHAKKSTIIKNTRDHVEIAFTDNVLNMDWEVRYTMLNDTKGVYFSLKLDHKANYPDTQFSEIRLVLRLKSNPFSWLQVEDDVGRYLPTAEQQKNCQVMGPKEACKSIDALKHDVHGFATKNGLGCWFVTPSMEWKNGGAYNRDLACHQGENDSLQIMYMAGSHYGAGDEYPKRGENWSKVYGPYLIYLNKAGSPQASWRDAKAVAKVEKAKWPYSFVSQPGYVKQRGTVTGKLTIKNPLNKSAFRLEDAVVTLVQPESSRESIPNQQWRHYSFWTHSLSGVSPNFSIKNVIPGTYQLRAWSKGVVGEFILNKTVTVTAGRTTNLGEIVFTEKRVGPIAWEIGIPDRTAKEFKHGNHFNQWGLPYKFPKEFPNGVNYHIGKSNYARDWNYCHVSVPGKGGKYQSIPWNIYFNLKKKPTGTSVLRVSVAANSSTALSVSINGGRNSAEVADFKDDACVRRDGIRGFYRELEFKFGPNDFKVGENKITLHARKTGGYTNNYQFDGIMYDHLRLETPGL